MKMDTRLIPLLIATVIIMLEGYLPSFGYALTSTQSRIMLAVGSVFAIVGFAAYAIDYMTDHIR